MRTIAWLACGLALLALKNYCENADATMVAEAIGPVWANLLPSVLLMGLSTCFYRALRSVLRMIINGGKPKPAAATPALPSLTKRAASRIFAPPPDEQFDADAAFARFMEQRESVQSDADVPGLFAPPAKSHARTRVSAANPPTRTGFGRRVL